MTYFKEVLKASGKSKKAKDCAGHLRTFDTWQTLPLPWPETHFACIPELPSIRARLFFLHSFPPPELLTMIIIVLLLQVGTGVLCFLKSFGKREPICFEKRRTREEEDLLTDTYLIASDILPYQQCFKKSLGLEAEGEICHLGTQN